MPTEAELLAAREAGYLTPSGQNMIRDGDDAISNNAVTAHQAASAARYDRGPFPLNGNMATLAPGAYDVRTYAVAQSAQPALPAEARAGGSLIISPGTTYKTVEFVPVGMTERPVPVWRNEFNVNLTPQWLGWHRVDANAIDEELAEKVDTSDPRLEDARPPTQHTHEMEDTEGLLDELDTIVRTSAPVVTAATSWDFPRPGIYGIWTDLPNSPTPSTAQSWSAIVSPIPSTGNLVVTALSWTTPGEAWVRRKNDGAWGPWARLGGGSAFSRGFVTSWNFTEPGLYSTQTSAGSPTPTSPQSWTVYVGGATTNAGDLTALAVSWSNPTQIWTARKTGGAWSPWRRIGQDLADAALAAAKAYTDDVVAAIPSPAVTGDVGIHQHEMRLSDLRQRIGAPRMGGKAAITLIVDHGTNNFASIVLPALRASGLRCTLALNSQMYDQSVYAHYAHENATTWAQVKGWHDNDGIEIANHGRTHKDATGEAAIRLEIEGGRQELEAALPGVKIDTWVQIGTTGDGTKWDGFNDGASLARYWDTYAGRVILDSHALATGQVPHGGTPNRVYPLDGHPVQGASGYWLDGGQAAIDTAKAKIDEAVATGGGVILRLHPYLIGWANQISVQQLTDLLTYLKGRQDAGELAVLPYREWALAVGW